MKETCGVSKIHKIIHYNRIPIQEYFLPVADDLKLENPVWFVHRMLFFSPRRPRVGDPDVGEFEEGLCWGFCGLPANVQ